MNRVVFLRHGQSTWNLENRFTGWTDVDLSERGRQEAYEAGIALRDAGHSFDAAVTSVLKRSIRTLWIVQDVMDQMWIPVQIDWRLNERHYGALQGLNKAETAAKYGEDQVHRWRRGYAVRPPALAPDDPRLPRNDPRYRHLNPSQLPACESLADTMARTLPCWKEAIVPRVRAGERLLVVAHGNSLRALVKHLDHLSDVEIMELNIPTGIPLIYEFDSAMRVRHRQYLGDPERVQAAAEAVARQATKG